MGAGDALHAAGGLPGMDRFYSGPVETPAARSPLQPFLGQDLSRYHTVWVEFFFDALSVGRFERQHKLVLYRCLDIRHLAALRSLHTLHCISCHGLTTCPCSDTCTRSSVWTAPISRTFRHEPYTNSEMQTPQFRC